MKQLIVSALALLFTFSTQPITNYSQSNPKDDRQMVVDKLHSIFDAFVSQNKDVLRSSHSEDWMGFFANSTQITSGLDGYLNHVSFDRLQMVDYEIQDIKVQISTDI